ncbi:MAG: hypothetical protein KAH77_11100, partial [Thiomargarita sp.]|nr:hypothetical protein [Thiomargarita sp.]
RRARIFLKSSFGSDWAAKLNIEFNDQKKEVKLLDSYLKYKAWEFGDITIGKAKEPFGLEVLNSNKYINMIERSMASIAFGPSYSYGIKISDQIGTATYAGGVYIAEQEADNKETYAWTGRVTYAPRLTEESFIHFGLAGSYRDITEYHIEQTAEVHTAEKIITSELLEEVNDVTLLGIETAVVVNSFSLQAEYMQAAIDSDVDDVTYHGYYIQTDYFLTGESRAYKQGHFTAIQDIKGAWQLLARLSVLDAYDNNIGIKAENMTLGINYYANTSVRISANYIRTDIKGSKDDDGQALSFRFQYIF